MRTTSSPLSASRRRGVVALTAAVPLLLATGCSSDDSDENAAATFIADDHANHSEHGWAALHLDSNEVESYESLSELGAASDAIVVGRASRIDGVRRVGPTEAPIELAQVIIAVDTVAHHRSGGTPIASEVTVEFMVPPGTTIDDLETTLRSAPTALLALRDKGGTESGRYRLVNQGALWTESDSGIVAGIDASHATTNDAELQSIEQLQRELLHDAE